MHILAREIPEIVAGEDADLIERLWTEGLVGPALRRPRRRGRAGAVGARHRAVGPEGASGANLPLCRLLGGNDPQVPCYAGGIDLDLSVEDLLKQTDGNLAKGFRAIKMKVGRERLSRGRRAGRAPCASIWATASR